MEYQRFIEQLPSFYDNWGKESMCPKSNQFESVLKQVKGMTSANVMQLLNFAMKCMEPNEVYCEVGCFQGASLIGAMLGHPDKMAYAVDDFSEFESFEYSFKKLIENLHNFELDEQVIFCEQDFEQFFFELKESQLSPKFGIYFYDGYPDYRSQLMGLLLVKPFLADCSIIVLNNCKWEAAHQASLDFIATHDQSRLLLDLTTSQDDNFLVENGLQIIAWDVNCTNQSDWSSSQKLRQHNLIWSIYELHVNHRKQVVDAWQKKALELLVSGQYKKAELKYKQILNNDINQAEVWFNLGMLYYRTERYQDALDSLLKALELDSSKAIWHHSVGMVLEKVGAITQAIRAYQEALGIDPQWISSYNSLGNILFEAGELAQAESMYRQVLVACPEHFAGYLNLGNVLLARNQVDEAIEAYEKALSLKPRNPDILNNLALAFEAKNEPSQSYVYLGFSFYRQGQYQEAIAQFQKVTEPQARDIDFYLAIADCYEHLNEYEEAIKLYQEGISLYPKARVIYLQLARLWQKYGHLEAAFAVFKKALQVLHDDLMLKLSNQLMLPIIYENTEEIEFYRERFSKGLEELIQHTSLDTPEAASEALICISGATNFYLAYQGKNDLKLQTRYGQFIHRIMAVNYQNWTKSLPKLPLNEGEKIRVGYVSASFRNHTVGKLSLGWIKYHNKQNFKVYCYYTGSHIQRISRQFQLYSNVFYHIPGDLEAVCQQILTDKLHILVFTDIGMNPQTSLIAGLRIAPVQCTTWAHPITSGLPTIDYYLSSDLMEPAKAQEHYSEELVCLPNIGVSYEKEAIPNVTKMRSEFQLSDEAIVYLSCQSLYKYLPQYDYIFPAIAQQVPQAQFAFLCHPDSLHITDKFRQRLKRAFALYNLKSEDYCVILPQQDNLGYLNLNLISNIFLDTFSWSGGKTTLDAIACNLPVVTCPGEFMRGRHSYAILKMLGVTETIAKNEAEYIEIAVKLGLEQEWRDSIVRRMQDRHCYLYDDKTCVEALETFYKQVVQNA